jgi:hypothetical protein
VRVSSWVASILARRLALAKIAALCAVILTGTVRVSEQVSLAATAKRPVQACASSHGCALPETPPGCRRKRNCVLEEPDVTQRRSPTLCGSIAEQPWSDGEPCTVRHEHLAAEDVYTISNPVVNRPDFAYRGITLEPNDEVRVQAGACVQTGGAGATWKRYVNPSGARSGPFAYYHGTVALPNGFYGNGARVAADTPIQTVISRGPLLLPELPHATGQPQPTVFLSLGYRDAGDYTDNGYWGHDNGNNNQCAINHDGGNAWVIVQVIHAGHLTVPVPTAALPWDVVADPQGPTGTASYDSNGLPVDPAWGWQVNPAPLQYKNEKRVECEDFVARRARCKTITVRVLVPHGIGNYEADCGSLAAPTPPVCTAEETHYNPADPSQREPAWVKQAAAGGGCVGGGLLGGILFGPGGALFGCGLGAIIGGNAHVLTLGGVCTQGGAFSGQTPVGHLNWQEVTYDEGTVKWDSWDKPDKKANWLSGAVGIGKAVGDDDVTLQYEMPPNPKLRGRAGVAPWLEGDAERKTIGIEFNASETIDKYGLVPFWGEFSAYAHETWTESEGENLNAKESVKRLVDNKRAVVTGALGIDGVHGGGQTEIHPVHTLGIEIGKVETHRNQGTSYEETEAETDWAFFARNWGNEGFCSTEQVYLNGLDHLVVRLVPPAGGTWYPTSVGGVHLPGEGSTTLNADMPVSAAGIPGPVHVYAEPGGVYVEVPMGAPTAAPWIAGELPITWVQYGGLPTLNQPIHSSATAPSNPQPEGPFGIDLDSPEARIQTLVSKLGTVPRELFVGLAGGWNPGTIAISKPRAIPVSQETLSSGRPPHPSKAPRLAFGFDAGQAESILNHDYALNLATDFGHALTRATPKTACALNRAIAKRSRMPDDVGLPGFVRRPPTVALVPGLAQSAFRTFVARHLPRCR